MQKQERRKETTQNETKRSYREIETKIKKKEKEKDFTSGKTVLKLKFVSSKRQFSLPSFIMPLSHLSSEIQDLFFFVIRKPWCRPHTGTKWGIRILPYLRNFTSISLCIFFFLKIIDCFIWSLLWASENHHFLFFHFISVSVCLFVFVSLCL